MSLSARRNKNACFNVLKMSAVLNLALKWKESGLVSGKRFTEVVLQAGILARIEKVFD